MAMGPRVPLDALKRRLEASGTICGLRHEAPHLGLGLGVLVNSESLYLLKVELISATKPPVPFNA